MNNGIKSSEECLTDSLKDFSTAVENVKLSMEFTQSEIKAAKADIKRKKKLVLKANKFLKVFKFLK